MMRVSPSLAVILFGASRLMTYRRRVAGCQLTTNQPELSGSRPRSRVAVPKLSRQAHVPSSRSRWRGNVTLRFRQHRGCGCALPCPVITPWIKQLSPENVTHARGPLVAHCDMLRHTVMKVESRAQSPDVLILATIRRRIAWAVAFAALSDRATLCDALHSLASPLAQSLGRW